MTDTTEISQAVGYDYGLVVLALVVAVFAAYTTADIVWRTSMGDTGKAKTHWLWLGGIVLGLGAWAAHLIGMLAAKEHFSFTYRTDITALSILLVLIGGVSALFLIGRCQKTRCLLASGVILGLGLVAMCFTGMQAILMPGMQHSYDYWLVALSWLVAVIFGTLALYVLRRFYHGRSSNPGWEKVAFAMLMATAILGMHYTDMASMQMSMSAGMAMGGMPAMASDIVGNNTMALAVSSVVVAVMFVALWSSHLNYRRALRERTLLQEAKESTDALLRDIVDGIIIINEQGIIQSFNPAAERVFGYTAGEVIGKNVALLMPEPHCSLHDGYIRDYLDTGLAKVVGIGSREVEGLRNDGTVFQLEVAVSEVRFGERRLFASVVRDITRRKEIETRLNYMAHHDALTGLPSRSLFRDRAAQALRRANRAERLVAIMYLDLDHFKRVNDNLGHETGDSLLRAAAERISACVRTGDTVSRLGGDEFAAILEDLSSTNDAISVARKILDAMLKPFRLDGHEIRISVSIGITIYPFDDQDLDSLLRDADIAMYRAKQHGRNNCQLYSADMMTGGRLPGNLAKDIAGAFERGELLVYYQPRVDMLTGMITEVEALLRWKHPKYGLLDAGEFISLLEARGRIDVVGEWVLRTACARFRTWWGAGRPLTRLTVNLSVAQLRDVHLAEKISQLLGEAGLSSECLELDIPGNYSDLSKDAACTAGMEELRKLGVHLSLEDAYAGYSFLEFLHHSPVDTLKIDRSLVRHAPEDRDSAVVLHALIAMARALKLKAVAEGIESKEELEMLRECGCDAVQGYLFSPAVPPEELDRLLSRQGSRKLTENPG